MKKILIICVALVNIATHTLAQSDSIVHAYFMERLQEAKTAIDSAEVYYSDFIYYNGGEYTPYESYHPFNENDSLPRTLLFPYGVDSALTIFRRLYWNDDMEHLYFPIVQLEHALGLPHDFTIAPPDTSDFYMPLQSGTYNDLGLGWQTNYTQYLYPHAEWALRHCKHYTNLFRDLDEPSLWKQQDTMLRVTVTHLPHGNRTMIRVYKDNGQPMAEYRSVYDEYTRIKSVRHIVQTRYEKKQLTEEQWNKIVHLAAAIDSLPWEERGTLIDGNRYWFEYSHDSSYHSNYSCWDRTELWEYLKQLFPKPKKQIRHYYNYD